MNAQVLHGFYGEGPNGNPYVRQRIAVDGPALCSRQPPADEKRHSPWRGGKRPMKVRNIKGIYGMLGVSPAYVTEALDMWVAATNNNKMMWAKYSHDVLQAWALTEDSSVRGERVRNVHVICATAGGGHGKALHNHMKTEAKTRGIQVMVLSAANYTLTKVYDGWGYDLDEVYDPRDNSAKYYDAHHGEAVRLDDRVSVPMFGMRRLMTPALEPIPPEDAEEGSSANPFVLDAGTAMRRRRRISRRSTRGGVRRRTRARVTRPRRTRR
jgi:hypothetical protein